MPGRHQLLGVQRGDQDNTVRGADRAQFAADLRAAGGQAAARQADGQRTQVGGQGAPDGSDHSHAAGRAPVVPDHRVPAGHTGAAHAAAGQTVLPGLLPEHGRGHGHAGPGQLGHQLHTVLRDEPAVPQHVQPTVPAVLDLQGRVAGAVARRQPDYHSGHASLKKKNFARLSTAAAFLRCIILYNYNYYYYEYYEYK